MEHAKPVAAGNVDITDGFWARRQKLNREVTLEAVRKRFEETGRFAAFHCDWTEDSDLPEPHVFWDSDIAKWLESAARILQKHPDAKLESYIEEIVDCIERHRDPCGYFNIYFLVCEPDCRFRTWDAHELYCAGHLTEAAVAYYEATGKDRFLRLMCDYMDYIETVFVTERSAAFPVPGHEEIELALVKLWRCTGEKRYLALAKHFIDERGLPAPADSGWDNSVIRQTHLPVRQQKTAEGHAVRACYLYCGMADVAKETDDTELWEACRTLFANITKKRMYITGGVGSSHNGEAFTRDFDLQNSVAYAETCAAIALAMFANRMKDTDPDSVYADTAERVFYNGFLSGVSLDGTSFFYENPLEILQAERGRNAPVYKVREHFPVTQRKKVFDCSCCPPNVTRFTEAFGEYMYSYTEECVWVHQFAESTASFDGVTVIQQTEYPHDGTVFIRATGMKGRKLCVRMPGWCADCRFDRACTVRRGYAVFTADEDEISVVMQMDMSPRYYEASPFVFADCGKVALTAGPMVYCMEAVDNGENLRGITVRIREEAKVTYDPYFDAPVIEVPGYRSDGGDTALYHPLSESKKTEQTVRFIPYFGFANRADCDMTVWFHAEK